VRLGEFLEERVEEGVARDVHGRHAESVDVGPRGVHAQLVRAEGVQLGRGRLGHLVARGVLPGLLCHPVLDDALEFFKHIGSFLVQFVRLL